jgi:hypothetical protein
MFSWDDPNQKVSFIVTTTAVAGSTYCFAGWLIWSVRHHEKRLAWITVPIREIMACPSYLKRWGGQVKDRSYKFKKLFERKPRDRTGQDTEVGQESGGVGATTILGSK